MISSLLYSCEHTFGRYELYLPKYKLGPKQHVYNQAMLGHAMFWLGHKTHKVIVQTSSKKVLAQNENYACFHLALAVIAAQSPKLIKSRQSISGFKMMQNAPLGACVYLRHCNRIWFCYKWAFLAPGAGNHNSNNTGSSLGVKNIFSFELDSLNYDAFETIPGCDVQFDFNCKTSF